MKRHIVELGMLMASIGVVFGLTGCGGVSSIVKNVAVRSYTNNNQIYVEATADVDLFGLTLPAVDIPIVDPGHAGQDYGVVSIKSLLTGSGNELSVLADVTNIANGGLQDQRFLPNGTIIPVGGLANETVASFSIGSSSRVYVGVGTSVNMVGIALVIPQLDSLLSGLPSLNFFPGFTINKINGVAGIFTSPTPSGSGFALFLDTTSAGVSVTAQGSAYRQNSTVLSSAAFEKAQFGGVSPGGKYERVLTNKLVKLSSTRARLSIE